MGKAVEAIEKAIIKLRRKRVSRNIFEQNQGTVRHGRFAGLKLGGDAHTSSGNLGAKTCGLYEQCVIEKIAALGPFEDVVNLGAADGYFSLGVLVAGMANRSICFEMDAQGRAAIARNAAANGLADRVEVRGIADDTTGAQLAEVGFVPAKGLVLCDIEGAEFDVLSAKVLDDLRGATLIVELHDRMMKGGLQHRADLIARLPEGARVEILKSSPADWRDIPEIEALSDNDRALVVSDGRKVLGEWLVVTY